MKRTFLLFFALVVSTMSLEDVVERIATSLNMTREEVQTCFNKTNVSLEDVMHLDAIFSDNLENEDFDDSALKVGCLVACIAQKKGMMTGAHVSVEEIKKIIHSQDKRFRPGHLPLFHQVLDICANRVSNKTNECEVSLKFILCLSTEWENTMKRFYSSRNNE